MIMVEISGDTWMLFQRLANDSDPQMSEHRLTQYWTRYVSTRGSKTWTMSTCVSTAMQVQMSLVTLQLHHTLTKCVNNFVAGPPPPPPPPRMLEWRHEQMNSDLMETRTTQRELWFSCLTLCRDGRDPKWHGNMTIRNRLENNISLESMIRHEAGERGSIGVDANWGGGGREGGQAPMWTPADWTVVGKQKNDLNYFVFYFVMLPAILRFFLSYYFHTRPILAGLEDYVLTSGTKQTLIYNPPAVLTIHLKRFEQVCHYSHGRNVWTQTRLVCACA